MVNVDRPGAMLKVKEAADGILGAVEKAVVGRRAELSALLAGFLAEGHVLLEGPPGTGKTLAVRVLAAASGCAFRRIQFTPDLMPTDVVGTHVYDPREGGFRLVRGPVFADVVLADEINRAPAKTQAALLEAMEERRATIDGESLELPRPFTVFATMNPIEFEGTFPLPEAQLDRFLMKVRMTDIEAAAEREVIARFAAGFDPWSGVAKTAAVLDAPRLLALRAEIRTVRVEEAVQSYLVEVVRRTRSHPAVGLGASTRAAVSLLRAAQAHAACAGREYVIPDDLKFLAPYVLSHRLVLHPEAQLEGVSGDRVVAKILDETPVPRLAAA
ncbi:MAG TPA: MoxR family ATPase [Myxococcales bacterium]|nr:MoxR family ATPase [Myxococcales bacterium]